MVEPINLRQARKRKARAEKAAAADANRLAHGRPKSETELVRARQDLAARRLDGHEREKPE
jgi:hypothetical protein